MIYFTSARHCGIIPARAGFTTPCSLTVRPTPDHPRSRGVYCALCGLCVSCGGSSPLARGLRATVRMRYRRGRIIPARAGFTSRQYNAARMETDHPRSRGVYSSISGADGATPGSSPLARGLRRSLMPVRTRGRIIPARAGFTCIIIRTTLGTRDHPRSRGVYPTHFTCWVASHGSSPLARGLHGDTIEEVQTGRIIPARAGFTTTTVPFTYRDGDHPRSRGVYRCGSGQGRRPWDHPRSRGVYAEMTSQWCRK